MFRWGTAASVLLATTPLISTRWFIVRAKKYTSVVKNKKKKNKRRKKIEKAEALAPGNVSSQEYPRTINLVDN